MYSPLIGRRVYWLKGRSGSSEELSGTVMAVTAVTLPDGVRASYLLLVLREAELDEVWAHNVVRVEI